LDGAFGGGEGAQFALEGGDYGGAGEKAAVIGEGGEPDQRAAVPEGGDSVADNFAGLRRENGADGGADFLQQSAGRFGDAG